MPLRFDDVPPGVAFEPPATGEGVPERIRAQVFDAHSGPAGGEVRCRRLGGEQWIDLPAKFQPGDAAGTAQLIALVPGDLATGTYVCRADVVDAAGNAASTTRRTDGVEMVVRKLATGGKRAGSAPRRSRIFARLAWHGRTATELTVPFRAGAALRGRFLEADGAGLAGRTLRVVSRPSRGALARARVYAVRTGAHGGFRLPLQMGTSRRIVVAFGGEEGMGATRRGPLTLRVRGGVDLHASPASLRTGEVLRLAGRVRTLGAPLPRRGKLVAIQYYEEAVARWRPVLVLRTDHSGRFRTRYRFRYVTGSAEIRLRAVALAEEGWPYAPGASRPLAVRVTG